MKKINIFTAGIFKENPIFSMLLGICSALAITNSLNNAFGMTMAVLFVQALANVVVSAIRKIVPNEIRIPIYVVVIATLVKSTELLMAAYTQELYTSLGIFIPLIVVNCMILGRAEAFASKNNMLDSLIDGIGMALGYGIGICSIALVRELLGTGGLTFNNPFNAEQIIFQFELFKDQAISIFTLPAGAFLTLGTLIGIINTVKANRQKKVKEVK